MPAFPGVPPLNNAVKLLAPVRNAPESVRASEVPIGSHCPELFLKFTGESETRLVSEPSALSNTEIPALDLTGLNLLVFALNPV